MNQQEKFYKETKKQLSDSNQENVLATLKKIRSTGEPFILPLLFDLLSTSKSLEIKEDIIKIISTLKDQECVDFICKEIELKRQKETTKDLIAACWQNGLDFSAYLNVFAEQFINGDYKESIEAFTVIEESLEFSKPEDISVCAAFLKHQISKVSEEKKPLYVELVKLLEG